MNKQELTDRLNAVGMRPGRGLGQNFLLDGNLLEWIVRKAAPAYALVAGAVAGWLIGGGSLQETVSAMISGADILVMRGPGAADMMMAYCKELVEEDE